jgi:rabenosyn-5
MLPRFQKLLTALQDPIHPPSPAQLAEATKVRRRLTESFTQFDVAARRIRDMPTTSPTQLKLQKQVYQQAAAFVHLHMLPLKSLPKILKHASPHGASTLSNGALSPDPHAQRGPLAAIRQSHSRGLSADDSTSQSSRISSLETEEKQLREQLIVLEEQRFLVGEMVTDAQRRRKVEEVESLGRNLDDLNREVDKVQGALQSVRSQFEGVYTGG